ncbi:hypothetical protein ACM614_12190 [Streptomyces sp. 12297]
MRHATPAHRARNSAFDAFQATHHATYLAYARAHLPDDLAHDAVHRAFGLIAGNWSYLVSQPSPAQEAWTQLVGCTGSRHRPLPVGALTALQYDALVLHHRCGRSVAQTACVTGVHPSKIRYLLDPSGLAGRHSA